MMLQVRNFQMLGDFLSSVQRSRVLIALIFLCPAVANCQDVLGTNTGVVQTATGVEQVQCHLIGAGHCAIRQKRSVTNM